MTMTAISTELRDRVQNVIDGDNSFGLPYIQCGSDDCGAIARNILSGYAEDEITDEVIESEVEIFYNA